MKIVARSNFEDERPFQREFEGIKRFDAVSRSHPTQLALFHVGKGDGFFYYVMELADPLPASAEYHPHTLRSDLENGRLPAAKVLELGLTLAEALHHLHVAGLVHRDVKPSNIIYVRRKPKLADIGLVTDASDSQSIVGTEGYLSREGPGTPAADLFALGKVLYEALTGLDRRQFPELPAHVREWPDAKLAFELNTIIVKLCAANADKRHVSAAALLADLEYLKRGKSLKRRHSLQRAGTRTLTAAAVIIVLSFAILFVKNERTGKTLADQPRGNSFAQSGTTNLEAWKALERGGKMTINFDGSGLAGGLQEYEKAVALDPNFTEAWTRLSMTLNLSVEKGLIPASNALPRAKFCAETAVKLDPRNAKALSWLATATLALDYDFAQSERLFRRASQLEPQTASITHNHAVRLWYQGRFDEAEAIFKKLLLDDPALGGAAGNLGLIYASQHRFPEALQTLDTAINLEPNWPLFRFERAEILWALGRRMEAAGDWLAFVEKDGCPSLSHEDAAALGVAFAQSPDQFLLKFIDLLEQRRAQGKFVSSYDLARLHANAGHKTRAIDYLEQVVDEHRLFALSARVHIAFKDFQDEARYHAALRRLNLER